MLNNKIEKALNEQINKELFSSYLYLAMAQWFESKSLRGFAHWLTMQHDEEHEHANKIIKYVNDRGGRVILQPIKGPKTEWSSPLEAFQETSKHEQFISQSIHEVLDLAIKENDHPTQSFLKWFVDEQVEEEANAQEIVDHLKMLGDAKHGIFMMDRQLAERKED